MFEIAIDTGGTFTDGVLRDAAGKVDVAKFPTNLVDPELGLMGCIAGLARERGLEVRQILADTSTIVIGTTIATNAIVSKKGAKCCMITTRGFRDMLELSSRIPKDDPYDLRVPPPEFLIPRYLRFEVDERIQYDGAVITPLNSADVHAAIQKAKEQKVEVPVVCFLHSYQNPAHEQEAGALIKADFPNVVLSSDILRKRMEGYRFHTAVLAAYVKPPIINFITKLERRLRRDNFKGALLFITCAGGVAAPRVCQDNPALMIGSGPAAGPLFSKLLSDVAGFTDIASIDIGGTTADMCILPKGKISTTTERIVVGHRNAVESVDVNSIGVGGGAIARIDDRGILQVGPESAGADPGPACYGKGGLDPTLTDADVVLGHIPADFFLGGTIPLDAALAREAIKRQVAVPLDMDVTAAAYAISAIARENIAKQILLNFFKSGHDPRDFTLVVGGGSGPVHAAALAERLKMKQLYIPRHAALFCPFGILLADFKYILSRFYNRSGHEIETAGLGGLYSALERQGVDILREQGIAAQDVHIVRGAAMRYVGQLHSIDVFLPEQGVGQAIAQATTDALIDGFHAHHEELYGRSDPEMPVTIEEVKLHAIAKRRSFKMTAQPLGLQDASAALKRRRDVYFKDLDGFVKISCYDSEGLKPGHVVEGPAIIEDTKTTVMVPQNFRLQVDGYGNFLLKRG